MSHGNVSPQSLQEVWAWTRQRFAEKNAAHTDAILLQIGDRVVADPPDNLKDDDQLALQAWQVSGPNDRHWLAQLFMRTVGHQDFLD